MTIVTMFLGALKDRHHRHGSTRKVWRRVQREPLQRRLFALRRTQNLLAGRAFDGYAVKSAFALLSQKVTKAAAHAAMERNDHD